VTRRKRRDRARPAAIPARSPERVRDALDRLEKLVALGRFMDRFAGGGSAGAPSAVEVAAAAVEVAAAAQPKTAELTLSLEAAPAPIPALARELRDALERALSSDRAGAGRERALAACDEAEAILGRLRALCAS
jgi:hypothetical protein